MSMSRVSALKVIPLLRHTLRYLGSSARLPRTVRVVVKFESLKLTLESSAPVLTTRLMVGARVLVLRVIPVPMLLLTSALQYRWVSRRVVRLFPLLV